MAKTMRRTVMSLLMLMTLVLLFTPVRTYAATKKYTVKFVDTLNKNKVISKQTVAKGKAAKAPKAPSHSGYEFKKWNSKAYKKVTKNLTIKTVYVKNVSVLTFKDGLTGKKISTLKVKNGEYARFPSAPKHDGYTFSSWSGSVKNNTVIKKAKDVTITAKYTANKYTIKYQSNGGTGTMADTTATYGKTFNLPKNKFTKQFYSFAGWVRTSDNKSFADGASVSNLATSGTIYLKAQWKETPVKAYKITYNLDGGTNAPENPTSYDRTTRVVLKAPKRAGYKFAGWTGTDLTSPTKSVSFSGKEGNRTYTATWASKTWVVKFATNGGKGIMDPITMTSGQIITVPACTFTRDRYKFSQWNTKGNGTGKVFTPGTKVGDIAPESESGTTLTVYAIWVTDTSANVKVSISASGGRFSDSSTSKIIWTGSGQTITLPDAPSRTGYNFDGWKCNRGSIKLQNGLYYYTSNGSDDSVSAVWVR